MIPNTKATPRNVPIYGIVKVAPAHKFDTPLSMAVSTTAVSSGPKVTFPPLYVIADVFAEVTRTAPVQSNFSLYTATFPNKFFNIIGKL